MNKFRSERERECVSVSTGHASVRAQADFMTHRAADWWLVTAWLERYLQFCLHQPLTDNTALQTTKNINLNSNSFPVAVCDVWECLQYS